MSRNNVQNKNIKKKQNTWAIAGVVIFIVLLVIFIANLNQPTNEYLKNIVVSNASIAEKAYEDGKFYVRLNIRSDEPNVYVNSDDSWFEVQNSYYLERNIGDETGVLLGNYDIFKEKLFGKGQKFVKSVWAIEDVYKTYDDAQKANPKKSYTGSATLKKKKTTTKGVNFFVIESEERIFNVEVKKETFNKYSENQKVECEFEALGDFVKILGVKD